MRSKIPYRLTDGAVFPVDDEFDEAGSIDARFRHDCSLRRRREADDAVGLVAAADRQRRRRRRGVDFRLAGESDAGSGNARQSDDVFLVDFRNVVRQNGKTQRVRGDALRGLID